MPACIKRRSRPRRGRVVDTDYLAFIHTQPCAVIYGEHSGCMTAHHVRRFGEPKNDRRVIPLCEAHHMHDFGKYSIERLGKRKFEAHFGVSLELLILGYQKRYKERAA